MTNNFAEWKRTNPPPDVQALIKHYGNFEAITPEAWKEYDDDMLAWKMSYRAQCEDSGNEKG
jgi:hypothetical protein